MGVNCCCRQRRQRAGLCAPATSPHQLGRGRPQRLPPAAVHTVRTFCSIASSCVESRRSGQLTRPSMGMLQGPLACSPLHRLVGYVHLEDV